MLSNLTVIDFETSGLDPAKERVIEMAAIRVVNGVQVTSFSALIRFDGELPAKITEITGLTGDMLSGGMEENRAFRMLRAIMEDSTLVAHNAAFDLQFLHHTMQRLIGETFSNPFIDTMTIARDRHPFPHRLEPMCDRYGIKLEGAHRALNDVEATYKLLMAMDREKPVDEWINRLGYLRKYGPPKWAPDHAELFGTDNRYAG